MKEHGIQNAIRNALAGACLAFRANVGQAWAGQVVFKPTRDVQVWLQPGDVVLRKARPFNTGLPKGFSDLFGIKTVTITADMVGKRIAQFFALEVKAEKGRASADQSNFLAAVERAGGLSGIARSEDEARAVLGLDA